MFLTPFACRGGFEFKLSSRFLESFEVTRRTSAKPRGARQCRGQSITRLHSSNKLLTSKFLALRACVLCQCGRVRDASEKERGCSGLSISVSVWFLHAGTYVKRVILREIWRAGRAGQTVQRKGQLCNYTIGSWDK